MPSYGNRVPWRTGLENKKMKAERKTRERTTRDVRPICATLLGIAMMANLSVSAAQGISPHYDKHRILERQIGDWAGKARFGGREYEARATNSWAPGKSGLVYEETYWHGDNPNDKVTLRGPNKTA